MTSSKSRTLQLAMVNRFTIAEGPGLRFAVWVQGCPIRCADCFNPHMFEPTGGRKVSLDSLVGEFDRASSERPELEGITLLGGEPFAQAEFLAEFAQAIRARGKSVLTFSGYTYKHLKAGRITGALKLVKASDVLIAGPYVKSQIDKSRPLLGSQNQEYIFLTDRYTQKDFEMQDRVEITLAPDGSVTINGWAEASSVQALADSIRDLGFKAKA